MAIWRSTTAFSGAVRFIAVRTCTALPLVASAQDLDLVNATPIDGTIVVEGASL